MVAIRTDVLSRLMTVARRGQELPTDVQVALESPDWPRILRLRQDVVRRSGQFRLDSNGTQGQVGENRRSSCLEFIGHFIDTQITPIAQSIDRVLEQAEII